MHVSLRLALVAILFLGNGCATLNKVWKRTVEPPPEKPKVDARYDFGGFHDTGRWYRGNLHLHSTFSDGKLDPVPTVELYRKKGYDFTAITDHYHGFFEKDHKTPKRPIAYPLDQMNKPGFLVIPGIEHDTNRNGETIHIVVVGPGHEIPLTADDNVSEVIQRWWDKGAFVVFAHPHWSLDATSVLEDLKFLPALEMFNYAVEGSQGLRAYSGLYWDRLSRKGRRVYGVANDDLHRPEEHLAGGWVMVKAKELTAEAILKSLREGKFYATSGPTFEDVYMDEKSNIHVRCSPVTVVRALSGVGGDFLVKAKPGKTLTEATIPWQWKGRSGFVRVECTDANGRMAWTQAVFYQGEKSAK
ncbi:MAG: CehA/McbA family metallohydrolase [Candidatus Sumerlaeia bacterium]|nr:CehA/McbA family metallohydrolase [Candidatus Sumerlaeia bacterium]